MGYRTVILTGGAGFIGIELVRLLINMGFRVIVVDNFLFNNKADFQKEFNIPDERIIIFDMPVRRFVSQFKEWNTVESVIHLAGLSNDPMANFSQVANQVLNYDDTQLLVDATVKYKIKRFIFASSASVYGMMDDYPLCESGPVDPAGHYGKAKFNSEKYIEQKCIDSDTRYVILRKATVMGVSARMRFDLVVNAMVKDGITKGVINLQGGGENWRPLIAIQDVCEIYNRFVGMPYENFLTRSNRIYNCVHKNYRISELALWIHECLSKLGHDCRIDLGYDKPRDIRSYRMLGNNLEMALNWTPAVGVKEITQDITRWIFSFKRKSDLEAIDYYNIKWLQMCASVCKFMGKEFDDWILQK